ncbi:hypothetical protein AUC47_05515 [Microbacterium sp. SZ1]|uniref:hypothetical protein n=1 Tax=Microbacterium sp. SZ1 TaxID=1849736 RepID=UPI000BBB76C6|nr:hypothetical protein [Microbacterium sp. SZ1]PCE14098.1 hypothetical protein AUC47_05515 [Microbacterium sp. SZ1]
MKEDFLRPPATPGEWLADALRLIGVLGVIAAAIWLKPTDAGIAALALPALMLPRMLGLAAWFDVTTCATVLVAAWSNVFDLYRTVSGWDLVLHFLCTGVLSVVAAVILTRTGVVALVSAADGRGIRIRRRTPIVLVPLLALAISAVWEMIEWLGWRYISDDIFVTYPDTIGDMVLGGLGGVAAGVLLALVPVGRHALDHEARKVRSS